MPRWQGRAGRRRWRSRAGSANSGCDVPQEQGLSHPGSWMDLPAALAAGLDLTAMAQGPSPARHATAGRSGHLCPKSPSRPGRTGRLVDCREPRLSGRAACRPQAKSPTGSGSGEVGVRCAARTGPFASRFVRTACERRSEPKLEPGIAPELAILLSGHLEAAGAVERDDVDPARRRLEHDPCHRQ